MATSTQLEALKAHLSITDNESDTALIEVIDAVDAAVDRWLDGEVDYPEIRLGKKMLAGRWYRRRNSPGGLEPLGELGPVYVSRNDPDIADLLGLGSKRRLIIS
ncbi:head-tail connector protein [Corynebacterium striatum]